MVILYLLVNTTLTFWGYSCFLAASGLNDQHEGWKRLIIEKPFGYDYKSATELKDLLLKDWSENQLFRIDHYLGKETVQNLLVTRFSNGIF